MFGKITAVIEFIKLVVDAYYYIDGVIKEETFKKRMRERKKLREQYMNVEKKRLRLEILKELGR